jgi:MFS family permease
MNDAVGRLALTKVVRRILPLLFILYIVNILDRVNVGFARLQMLGDLDIKEGQYGFLAGVFYLGYFVFEVPSNLLLRRTGARRWIARILVSWGLTSCAMMAVQGPWGFALLRVLLGFAEAGFFPGIILYLTFWFPARERARAVALFMIGAPVTGIVNGVLSGAIMQYLDQVAGLRGWQWLFLLEGLPAVVLGFVVLYCLPDRPHDANWLTPAEQDWLAARVGAEEERRAQRHSLSLGQLLSDGRVWLLCGLYVTLAVSANCMGFYLPKLLNDRYPGRGEFQIGLLTAIPNVCAGVCMFLNGMHSDRTGERRWHVAVPAFIGAVGWALSAWAMSPAVQSAEAALLGLTLVQAGTMATLPVFWSLPTAFLSGVAAAGGIAWINSVGNLGGFVGPLLMGQLHEQTSNFSLGLTSMAIILGIGGVLALCVRHDSAAETHFS